MAASPGPETYHKAMLPVQLRQRSGCGCTVQAKQTTHGFNRPGHEKIETRNKSWILHLIWAMPCHEHDARLGIKAPWYPHIQSFTRLSALPRPCGTCVYFFLPDFLIPCCPVFMGPFPPAFLAISSRAFLSDTVSAVVSLGNALERCGGIGREYTRAGTYRLAASQGKPCHRRRAPSLPPWASCCGWGWCRLFYMSVAGQEEETKTQGPRRTSLT